MPELPEVETTVRGLNQKVLERTFIDVWSDWKKIVHPIKYREAVISDSPKLFDRVKKPNNFEEFKKIIKGKKIKRIWRRAKNIIFDLSGGYSILVHQKMTGHLLVGNWELKDEKWKPVEDGPLNDPYNRFLHVIFFLDNSPSHKASARQSGKMMALSDARKFAKIELWKTEELRKVLEKLGPEPLDENFTFGKFKAALLENPPSPRLRRGKVKQVLMNPEIIAGIGNIYSSEILWRAKIHPEKNVAKLDEKELKSLYDATKKVLEVAVKLGGESFSDYRKPDGSKGNFDTERMAYKRENQKCHRCGTKIKRIKFGGRSAFFCPNCQKI